MMGNEEIRATAIKVAAEITAPMFRPTQYNVLTVRDAEQYLFVLADDITKYIFSGESKHL